MRALTRRLLALEAQHAAHTARHGDVEALRARLWARLTGMRARMLDSGDEPPPFGACSPAMNVALGRLDLRAWIDAGGLRR